MDHLDWIIVGAETGQKARPVEYNWVAALVRQAQLYSTPVFFKSWGKNDIHDYKIESLKQFPV
jgi:protein gp37